MEEKNTSKIWGNLLFSRFACRKWRKITSPAAIILDLINKIKSKIYPSSKIYN
jgi:hypothetical protein